MALDYGLTDTGLVLPRQRDYLDEVDARFYAATGLQLDSSLEANQDQVLVILTNIMAQLLDEQAQRLASIVDAQDPSNARGVQLTALSRITRTVRKRATYSTWDMVCTGTIGTALPEGRIVRSTGDEGTIRWASTEDAVIGADGTVTANFRAVEAGAKRGLAEDTLSIVSPISGWSSVSVTTDASVGTEEELDPALRRRRNSQLAAASGSAPGLRAALIALDFVDELVLLQNTDNETKTVSGVSMDPNSLLVVLLPTVLTFDQKKQVLTTIYNNAPLGVEISGTDVSGVVAENGEWPVAFDYGADITPSVEFTLELELGAKQADVEAALDELVEALAPRGLGEDLTRLELLAEASEVTGVRAGSVKINGVDDDLTVTIVQRVASISTSYVW